MSGPRTVAQLLDVGERVLSDSQRIFADHNNRYEAEQLMEHVLDAPMDEIDLDSEPPLRARERFLAFVTRRASGEPLPMLVGHIEFFGLDLAVKPGTFVPRPSSELTVDRALRRLKRRKAPVAIDVCTGSGPIALALAHELPRAEIWGTDIADEGIQMARFNARKLGVANAHFRVGDMYGALPTKLAERADVITGHVPYVPSGELEDLPEEVKEHEPIYTLSDESADGLELLRHAATDAPKWLKPGGWLLLEISEDLARKAERICVKAGLEPQGVASDDDGLSIVVEARKPQ